MAETNEIEGPAGSRTRLIVGGAMAVLAAVVVLGIWLVITFVNQERERDTQQWQIRCRWQKTNKKTHGLNIPVAETRDYLRGFATTLVHKLHHFRQIRIAFLAAEPFHHGDLFFAKFLFSTVLHKLLHHVEVGIAVVAAALLHHLIHHQTPQNIVIRLFICAFSF